MEALNKKKDEATVLLPISDIYIKYQGKSFAIFESLIMKDSASYPQLQNPWRVLSSTTPSRMEIWRAWKIPKSLDIRCRTVLEVCASHIRGHISCSKEENPCNGLLQPGLRNEYLFNRCFRFLYEVVAYNHPTGSIFYHPLPEPQ